MLHDIDNFFLQKDEPAKSCLLSIHEFILGYDKNMLLDAEKDIPVETIGVILKIGA